MIGSMEQVHPEPPMAGDETATLLGSLERQRTTLAWKCSGLDAAVLSMRLEPSAITLGDADPDWEWRTAAEDSPEELLTLWRDAAARSRAIVGEDPPRG